MKKILILFLILGISTPLPAQWTHCGPQGGVVTSFAVSGSDLLAGTTGDPYNHTQGSGIFRSGDLGKSWVQANAGLNDTNITALINADEYLFAGTESGDVYRSIDGKSWQKVHGMRGKTIAAFAAAGSAMFAATPNGIYRTFDGGDTWSAANGGLKELNIHSFAVIGTTVYANAAYDDTGGIYRTTDLGEHWSYIKYGAFDIAAVGDRLFDAAFHTVDNGVLVTSDGGKTWSEGEMGGCGVYDALKSTGTIIFSSHGGEIRHSTDSGATWTEDGLHGIDAVIRIGSTIFAGNAQGIFRSNDTGKHWAPSSNGIYMFEPGVVSDVYAFTGTGGTLIARPDPSPIHSTDGGIHWTFDTSSAEQASNLFTIEGSVLISTGGYGFYSSKNDGASWDFINDSTFDEIFADDRTVYAFDSYLGLYRSNDTGKTWTDISVGLDQGLYGFNYSMPLAADGNYLYAAPNALYRSSDRGNSWKNLTGALITGDITAITANGSNICVASGGQNYYRDGSGRMYHSTDDGKTWWATIADFRVNKFLRSGQTVVAATQQGIYYSNDNGLSWSLASDGMTPDTNAVYSFVIMDTSLYAATANGIWKRSLSEFGIAARVGPPPPTGASSGVELSLEDQTAVKVCPNPVADIATVQSVGSTIESVSIVNLLGEEVLDFKYPLSSKFDLSHLPTGTYFMKIATTDGITARKIVKQ